MPRFGLGFFTDRDRKVKNLSVEGVSARGFVNAGTKNSAEHENHFVKP